MVLSSFLVGLLVGFFLPTRYTKEIPISRPFTSAFVLPTNVLSCLFFVFVYRFGLLLLFCSVLGFALSFCSVCLCSKSEKPFNRDYDEMPILSHPSLEITL
jgi:energy-converting hydrogenase Eha subunit A